jgi:two-component system, NarL family, response regulator DesR
MPQAVLLVEDHPLVAEAMLDALRRSRSGLKIQVATDAAATLRHLQDPEQTWFRIFLDLDVPGAHGLSLARDVERAHLADRCCVVSASDRNDLIGEVKLLGFLGYIVKATPIAEFKRCVADVLGGTLTFPRVALDARPPIRLSRRQEQLLDCVRRGLTSKEIARVVLLSEGTVNNCINAALKALHVTSRSHAVAKALELGLLKVDVRAPDTQSPSGIDGSGAQCSVAAR